MQNIVALLKTERDKVARQLKGLNAALAAFAGSYTDGSRPRRRRKLSAQGLANIRAAQKARWAKQRGASADGGSRNTPKRRISAAGRARIAAAARARWAKIKQAKK